MKLLAYGTLKKGFERASVLSDSKFLGNDFIKGSLFNLGPYPAVSLDGKTEVKGEVYEIDRDTLIELDFIEGHPFLFKRKEVKTNGDHLVWVYYQDEPNGTIIEDGVWK